MKRQCTDPQPHPNASAAAAAAIFSDNHHFVNPNQPYSYPLPFPDNHHTTTPDPTRIQPDPKPNNNDGASIETQRRPRGRPPGSKNKPKPPNNSPTRLQPDPNPTNQQHILEVSNGADVIDAIAKFSRRHNTSLRIHHASGAVANVTIRQPNPHSTFTFHGRFDIVSLAAVFVTPSTQSQIPIGAFNNVSISLSIPKGQIIGGFVVGPLMASGSVFVFAESFSSLTYHRLDLEEEGAERRENNNTTSCGVVSVPMYSSPNFMPY